LGEIDIKRIKYPGGTMRKLTRKVTRKLIRKSIAGSLLALVFCLPILKANADVDPKIAAALEKAKKEIPRFNIVDDGKFYRGGRPLPQDLLTLKKLGIKNIVNLQGGDYDLLGNYVLPFEPGESYANIRQERTTAVNLRMGWYPFRLSTFAYVGAEERVEIKNILKILSDPTMQPVYVHCEFGQDRTGLIAALYEVFYLGERVAKAHARWVALGHSGQLNSWTTWELDNYFYAATSLLP
jgi:hypothetical protein